MRITSPAVLSLLVSIGMAAPAADNRASIIPRDDEEPAPATQPGQVQLPADSIGCGYGPAMRVYSRAQVDQVANFACRMTPNNMPGAPRFFPNTEGIQFGTPQNEALFEFPIGNGGFPGAQGPFINPYDPNTNPIFNNPNPNINDPNANNPNFNNPNFNNPNFNNPNFNNPNFGNPNFGNPNFGNPNAGMPNVSPDRVIYDQSCQAVGVVTQVNNGANWGQFWGTRSVACTNGIFGGGGDD